MARTLQVESINSSSTGLDLQTLNASRLFIKSDGNVGIGTNNPGSQFVVDNSTNPQITLFTAGTERVRFSTGGSAQSALAIHIGGSERIRINSAGYLGIKNTNPQDLLDLGNPTAGTGITWSGTSGTARYTSIFSAYSSGALVLSSYFHGSTIDDSYLASFTGTVTKTGLRIGSGIIQFFTDAAAAQTAGSAVTPTERMRIDSSGNVGIGTASPSAKLDVSGSLGIRVNEDGAGTKVITVRSNYSSIGPAINVTTNDPLLFLTNNTERVRIDSSGNVGIGTTSPIDQLQVSGTGRIHLGGGAVSTDTIAGIYFHGAGDTSYAIHRTTGAWTASAYQQLRMSFATGIVLDGGTLHDRSFVRVDGTGIRVATGNIGIGTTAKTLNYKLDVYGTTSSDCARIYSTGSTSALQFWDTNGTLRGYVYSDSLGFGLLNSSGSWALRVTHGNTNVVIPAGSLTVGRDIITNENYGHGHVGVYSDTRFQSVFAMGTPYTMKADGTSLSAGTGGNNFYGIAWSHPNVGGQGANLTNHGALFVVNGITQIAISSSIWCIGNITAYSDERVKTNWRNFNNNFVEKLAKVKSGIFDRTDVNEKENGLKTQVGVSAQSLREVIPDAVTCNSEGMLSVSYGNAAMASCVELAKEILKLKEEIDKLKENK